MRRSAQRAYVNFVDINKAFDTVNREMLWYIHGLTDNLISVTEKLNGNSELEREKDQLNQHLAGDPLAPILFLYLMQATMETMDQSWLATKMDNHCTGVVSPP